MQARVRSRSAEETKATLHLTLWNEGSKEGAMAKIVHAILWPSIIIGGENLCPEVVS